MTSITYKELEEVIEESNADVTVQRYSGRGMFGRECLGFSTDDPIAVTAEIVGGLADEDLRDRVITAFQNTRTDNLGLSIILYFPNIHPPKEELEPSSDQS
jgi:hypothetical protein